MTSELDLKRQNISIQIHVFVEFEVNQYMSYFQMKQESAEHTSLILSLQNPFPMEFRKLICEHCTFIAFIC